MAAEENMIAFHKQGLRIMMLFIISLATFVISAQAQTGVPVGGCKIWTDKGWVEVPCADGSSGSGSGGNSGAAGRRARGWVDCKLFGKGCPAKTDKRKVTAYELNEKGIEASKKGDYATAASYYEQALKNSPDDAVIKKNLAYALNAMGNEAYNKGDYATAASYYEQALKYSDDPTIKSNLAYVRAAMTAKEKDEKDAADAARRDKAAADKMQNSIQDFAKTLSAVSASGGLDFDGVNSGGATKDTKSDGLDFTTVVSTQPGSALQFGDPMVVDARNVPSGLPTRMDNAISDLYKDAPEGVSDRVRKGFQAVMERDWEAAKVWFQDALNRDPDNAGLKRLVKLTEYDKAAPVIQLPAPSDAELLFRPDDQPKAQPKTPRYMLGSDGKPVQVPDDYRGDVQTYAMGKDGSVVTLPRPSDFNIIFSGAVTPPPLSNVPIFRIDKAGNPVELPADYDGEGATYIKGKDGKLIQVPNQSDVKYLFPGTDPAPTTEPKDKKP